MASRVNNLRRKVRSSWISREIDKHRGPDEDHIECVYRLRDELGDMKAVKTLLKISTVTTLLNYIALAGTPQRKIPPYHQSLYSSVRKYLNMNGIKMSQECVAEWLKTEDGKQFLWARWVQSTAARRHYDMSADFDYRMVII